MNIQLMKIVKNMSFLKVSAKTDCRFKISVIFYVFQHRSKLIFGTFSKIIHLLIFFRHEHRKKLFKIESQKAFNHVLTFQNAGARRELSIDALYVTRASICVELRPFYCSKKLLVPMSDINIYIYIYILYCDIQYI